MSEPDAAYYVPDWLGRLADANTRVLELEADMKSCRTLVEELEKQCTHLERQRDRAEKKYDGACAMMAQAPGPEGWEVFVAGDGEKSIGPVDWRGRAEKAEADNRKFIWIIEQYCALAPVLFAVPDYLYLEKKWNEKESE